MKKNNFTAYITVILAMIFWSYTFIWYKVVYEFYNPITVVFFRLIIFSIFLFVLMYPLKKLQKIRKGDFKYFLLVATFNPLLYFLGIFLFAPLFFIIDFTEFKQSGFSSEAWIPLLELAIFGSSFAFIFFTFSIQRIGIGKANAFTNLIPVITAIIVYFVLDEILNVNKITGISLVIGGLFLSQIKTSGLRERIRTYIRPSE